MFRHVVCEVRRDLIYRLRHCRRPHASEFNVIMLLVVWLCVCVSVCLSACLYVCLSVSLSCFPLELEKL